LPEILNRLRNLEEILADAHKRVQQNIHAVEHFLDRPSPVPLSQKRRVV
jgi:hypothetical protein